MRRHLVFFVLLLLVALAAPPTPADGESSKKSDTAWLGVMLGGNADNGVAVSRIVLDSPAEKAGLRARDVVLTVDGAPVDSNADLIREIQRHDPGSWLPVTISRNGREIDRRVRLSNRPLLKRGTQLRKGWIGIEAIDLPAALRVHFGAPAEAGVMISAVAPGSPAEAAGFELGDVVYEIDEEAVGSPGELGGKIVGAGVGNRSEFAVMRAGTNLMLEAQIEKAPTKAEP